MAAERVRSTEASVHGSAPVHPGFLTSRFLQPTVVICDVVIRLILVFSVSFAEVVDVNLFICLLFFSVVSAQGSTSLLLSSTSRRRVKLLSSLPSIVAFAAFPPKLRHGAAAYLLMRVS